MDAVFVRRQCRFEVQTVVRLLHRQFNIHRLSIGSRVDYHDLVRLALSANGGANDNIIAVVDRNITRFDKIKMHARGRCRLPPGVDHSAQRLESALRRGDRVHGRNDENGD